MTATGGTGARPQVSRPRRIAASVFVVLGSILLMLASLGWWLDRYFLNTSRFTASANHIIELEDVQRAVSKELTHKISNLTGRNLSIAEPIIGSVTQQIVSSDAFRTVFDKTISVAHNTLVSGKGRQVVLTFSNIVDRVKDALEAFAPNVADRLPSGRDIRVKLLDEREIGTVYDIVQAVKDATAVTTIVSIVLIVAGVVLAPFRWRALVLTGWVSLGAFVVTLLLVLIGRVAVTNAVSDPTLSAAAGSTYRVIVHGLVVQSIALVALAAAVALLAGWTDRHSGIRAWQEAWEGLFAWARGWAPTRAPTAEPIDLRGSTAMLTRPVESARRALAQRLPEPVANARRVHTWRAVALLGLGLLAVLSPSSLTSIIVVVLGLYAIYLAVTESLAAWRAPKTDQADEPAAAR